MTESAVLLVEGETLDRPAAISDRRHDCADGQEPVGTGRAGRPQPDRLDTSVTEDLGRAAPEVDVQPLGRASPVPPGPAGEDVHPLAHDALGTGPLGIGTGEDHICRVHDEIQLETLDLHQLGRSELDVRDTATDHDVDVGDGMGVQCRGHAVRQIGALQAHAALEQHPGGIEGDVASADDGNRRGGHVPRTPILWVAVVPPDKVGRGDATREVLPRDPEPAGEWRPGLEHDGVAGLPKICQCHVAPELDVAMEPDSGIGQHPGTTSSPRT